MPELRQLLGQLLGSVPDEIVEIGGGCICEAYRVRDGQRPALFVKIRPNAPRGFFEAEAAGLAWLRGAAALPIPEVVAVNDTALALPYVERGAPGKQYETKLGEGLARLHLAGAPRFGLDRSNFIGTLVQRNDSAPNWASFYEQERLRPLVDETRSVLGLGLSERIESIGATLGTIVGPEEPPARLHGDLWSGNCFADSQGAPWLVDPAVYGGHREVDLAMMALFGGFGRRVFEAYEGVFPLAPGWRDRIPLYQLYPLLAHVALFGESYLAQLRAAVHATEALAS